MELITIKWTAESKQRPTGVTKPPFSSQPAIHYFSKMLPYSCYYETPQTCLFYSVCYSVITIRLSEEDVGSPSHPPCVRHILAICGNTRVTHAALLLTTWICYSLCHTRDVSWAPAENVMCKRFYEHIRLQFCMFGFEGWDFRMKKAISYILYTATQHIWLLTLLTLTTVYGISDITGHHAYHNIWVNV